MLERVCTCRMSRSQITPLYAASRPLNNDAPVADADMPNLYELAFKLVMHATAALMLILCDASTRTRHVKYAAMVWYIGESIRELAVDVFGYDTYHAINVCWGVCIDTR